MSFGEPTVLLGLLAVPLLVLWYLGEQRRRRLAAASFAAPALHPSVAPVRPRWRRHVPLLALALSLVILVFAAAQPQRTVAVPIERASIMLTTDVSGSMTAVDVKPNRLVAAKRAARGFVDSVPAKVNVGIVAFNQQSRVLQSPTIDRAEVKGAIDSMEPSGGTATGEAINASLRAFNRRPDVNGRRPPAAIVLLSDGASTSGVDPVAAAREAKRQGVRVYTVTLGTPGGTITVPDENGGTVTTPVPPDPESLEEIARASGGRAFTAGTSRGLTEVYEQLGSQLSHKDEKRQVTSAFAGGGLALLLAAAAMSLRWFGRLI